MQVALKDTPGLVSCFVNICFCCEGIGLVYTLGLGDFLNTPSPRRSPGNSKSDSPPSDTRTQTFLPINYISRVIKPNWPLWRLGECFGHRLAAFSVCGSQTSWRGGGALWPGLVWEEERWAPSADEQCWNVFSLSIHLNNVPFCTS